MTVRVRVRTPRQPDVPTDVPNPLYGYEFPSETANWESETRFSWRDMFGDVVSSSIVLLRLRMSVNPD